MWDIGQLLSVDRHGDDLIEAAKGLLSDEQSPKRRKILTDLLLNLDDRSELESRGEDGDWFKGTASSGDSGHPCGGDKGGPGFKLFSCQQLSATQ